MSMIAVQNPSDIAAAAYRLTTDGAITQPAPWQADLYALLSQPDPEVANLLLTPTGAGKTEAIVIASLGLHRGGAPRRLFHIRPDGATLDDPLYRVVPYLRAWVAADETPRTLCVDTAEEDGDGNECRRFFPDGTEDPHLVTNPLEADVDLILTTLSRFRSLFFGSGGIHALPSALPVEDADHPLRRDLFFFDEAHSYQPDAFASFHRLVEFLYAEDSDVIVASPTMPPSYQEELSFLDPAFVTAATACPGKETNATSVFNYLATTEPIVEIETQVRQMEYDHERVIVALETTAEAEELFARLENLSSHTFLYHPAQPAIERRQIYAKIRQMEQNGQGYLLLTTGDALETSDLNATRLLTTLCLPENLIRRLGRCNRRCDTTPGQALMFGTTFAPSSRSLPSASDYLAALREQSGQIFQAENWKQFI